MSVKVTPDDAVEAFIARWKHVDGTERSNAQIFVNELCELLGVDKPIGHSSEKPQLSAITAARSRDTGLKVLYPY